MEHIIEKIKDADLVLVGIGEEFDLVDSIKKTPNYMEIAAKTERKWILPYVMKILLEEQKENSKEVYSYLENCLDRKKYFVVSTCLDGMLEDTNLKQERIVSPCGGYRKLQCGEACSTDLYELSEKVIKQVQKYILGACDEDEIEEPVCPQCGKPLIFNNIGAAEYVEAGYMEQWQTYTKWLQGTINRKVCVLELGVGIKYPTVIRWPFEKITFFNQKSEFYRVHSKLYQMTEEIKERGHGICQEPREFLKELSNGF